MRDSFKQISDGFKAAEANKRKNKPSVAPRQNLQQPEGTNAAHSSKHKKFPTKHKPASPTSLYGLTRKLIYIFYSCNRNTPSLHIVSDSYKIYKLLLYADFTRFFFLKVFLIFPPLLVVQEPT